MVQKLLKINKLEFSEQLLDHIWFLVSRLEVLSKITVRSETLVQVAVGAWGSSYLCSGVLTSCRELSAQLLQMIPDSHVFLAQLCAFYPGGSAELDRLHLRVSPGAGRSRGLERDTHGCFCC